VALWSVRPPQGRAPSDSAAALDLASRWRLSLMQHPGHTHLTVRTPHRCLFALRPAQRWEKVANRNGRAFRWEVAHAAVTRRQPISLYTMVPRAEGYTYTTRKFGICLSFKDHFLSRRAKP
jgi:hypothetical protein